MPSYDELKSELKNISEILSQFPDSIQPKVFDILIEKYLGKSKIQQPIIKQTAKEELNNVKVPKRRASFRESFSIVKNLNLQKIDDKPSFQEFYNEKKPRSNIEFNVIAIYYLRNILKITGITLDHVYTCYKDVKRKVPSSLKQSIYDTSGSRYGYIDSSNINELKMPTSGENLVEHVLPKSKDK